MYRQTKNCCRYNLFLSQGNFSGTLMYYGYYSNNTLSSLNSTKVYLSYNMPLAYFFTIGMAFFITCIILVYRYCGFSFYLGVYSWYAGFKGLITSAFLSFKSLNSMSKSFGRSFRIDKSYSVLAVKTFCSWDFRVIKKNSTNLMSENISTQLKVLTNTPQHTHTLLLCVCFRLSGNQ